MLANILTAVTNDAVKFWDKAAEAFRLTVTAALEEETASGDKVAAAAMTWAGLTTPSLIHSVHNTLRISNNSS